MSESWREVIARALHSHLIDGEQCETGIYPCICGEFSADTPTAWDGHVADAILAALVEAGPSEEMIQAAIESQPYLRCNLPLIDGVRNALSAALRSATQEERDG